MITEQTKTAEGWVLVPVEPTPEMLAAGAECWHMSKDNAEGYYRAMLAAAPKAPPADPEMRAICEALGFDPTNHHNALKCPYCRPADPAQPCTRCDGTGVVDDGEINCYPDGTPYSNGPVKCVKDCPACSGSAPAQQATKGEASALVEGALAEFPITLDGQSFRINDGPLLKGDDDDVFYSRKKANKVFQNLFDCLQGIKAALAAQQVPAEPAGSDEPRHLLIAKIRALVIGVAEQQAMPDDWWKPRLADIIASLAPQPAAPVQPSTKVEREGLTGWINADDQKPPKNTEVLIAFRDSSLPATGQYTASPHDIWGWSFPGENDPDETGPIIHWMPLPPAPTVGEKK